MSDTNDEKWKRPEIMNLDQADQRYGQIYIIKCKSTNKNYVGKVVSHRLNKEKYRFFGIIGRFKDHISEAISNTKENQCKYLNSAIRKYGADQFTVELLENCECDDMDKRETYHIKKQNVLAPNGYNLLPGGKDKLNWINPKLLDDYEESELKPVLKRGRNFGYVHKESTIEKMKDRHTEESKEQKEKRENTMRATMSNHHKDKRINMLLKLGVEFDEDFANYIRPKKKGDEIVGYVIRINRARHGEITNKETPLEEKYNLLHEALEGAYKKQQEEKNKKIVPIKKVTKVIKKVTKDESSESDDE